jgi:hypothetical protein
MPETPAVFAPAEDRFFIYFPSEGIHIEQRGQDLAARSSELL